MNTRQTGKLGEDIACDYLRKNGYKILARNFEIQVSRFLKSEIDIIAKKNGIFCFIEVKALKGNSEFLPEVKVNFAKKQKLIKTAEIWLNKNKISLDVKWQIDIISIKLRKNELGTHKINHFKNAVSAI